jgi:hypothetical protein
LAAAGAEGPTNGPAAIWTPSTRLDADLARAVLAGESCKIAVMQHRSVTARFDRERRAAWSVVTIHSIFSETAQPARLAARACGHDGKPPAA